MKCCCRACQASMAISIWATAHGLARSHTRDSNLHGKACPPTCSSRSKSPPPTRVAPSASARAPAPAPPCPRRSHQHRLQVTAKPFSSSLAVQEPVQAMKTIFHSVCLRGAFSTPLLLFGCPGESVLSLTGLSDTVLLLAGEAAHTGDRSCPRPINGCSTIESQATP